MTTPCRHHEQHNGFACGTLLSAEWIPDQPLWEVVLPCLQVARLKIEKLTITIVDWPCETCRRRTDPVSGELVEVGHE